MRSLFKRKAGPVEAPNPSSRETEDNDWEAEPGDNYWELKPDVEEAHEPEHPLTTDSNAVQFLWVGRSSVHSEHQRALNAIAQVLHDAGFHLHDNVLPPVVLADTTRWCRLVTEPNGGFSHVVSDITPLVNDFMLELIFQPDPSNPSPDLALHQKAIQAAYDEVRTDVGLYRAEMIREVAKVFPSPQDYDAGIPIAAPSAPAKISNALMFQWLGRSSADKERQRALNEIVSVLQDAGSQIHDNVLEQMFAQTTVWYFLIAERNGGHSHLLLGSTPSATSSGPFFTLNVMLYPDPCNAWPDLAVHQKAIHAAYDELRPDFGLYKAELKHEPSDSGFLSRKLPTIQNYERGH